MPFRRVERAHSCDFSPGFVFAAARNPRRAAIEFNQRLHRGKIMFVQMHRGFEFFARFFRQRKPAEPAGAIRLLSVHVAQKFVISRTLLVERHRCFRGVDGLIELFLFVVGARQQILHFGIARRSSRFVVQNRDRFGIVAGGKRVLGIGGNFRLRACNPAAEKYRAKQKRQQYFSTEHYFSTGHPSVPAMQPIRC